MERVIQSIDLVFYWREWLMQAGWARSLGRGFTRILNEHRTLSGYHYWFTQLIN